MLITPKNLQVEEGRIDKDVSLRQIIELRKVQIIFLPIFI